MLEYLFFAVKKVEKSASFRHISFQKNDCLVSVKKIMIGSESRVAYILYFCPNVSCFMQKPVLQKHVKWYFMKLL